jgi:putative transposase
MPSGVPFKNRLNTWYNTEHHHRGLGLLTPHDVHFGLAEQRVAERAAVLTAAYAAHPERFPAGRPTPAPAPIEVWITPPPSRARSWRCRSLTKLDNRLSHSY